MRFDYSMVTAFASVIGVGFAIFTVYLVHFRHAEISSVLGPQIMMFYRDFNRERQKETVGLITPVTFVNAAMRTGVVVLASLVLYREDTPNERFYFEWDKFGKHVTYERKKEGETELTEKWIHDEEPHPLTVQGNSSITKMVCFYWFSSNRAKLILQEGIYRVVLCFWNRGEENELPKTESFKMLIDNKQSEILENCRKAESSATVYLRLDQKLEHNLLMSEADSKRLLGLAP